MFTNTIRWKCFVNYKTLFKLKGDIYIPTTESKGYEQLLLKPYHWDHLLPAKFNHTFSVRFFISNRWGLTGSFLWNFLHWLPCSCDARFSSTFWPPALTDTITDWTPQSLDLLSSPAPHCDKVFTLSHAFYFHPHSSWAFPRWLSPCLTPEFLSPNSSLQCLFQFSILNTEFIHSTLLPNHLLGFPANFPVSTAAFFPK